MTDRAELRVVEPARQPLSVAEFASLAGELVRHVDQGRFLPALGELLGQVVAFDNFIVYRYREGCAAELIHTNLDPAKLQADMAAYNQGLYLLDPFHIAATSARRRGVLRMEDVAPEAFLESEYYRMFYKDVDVLDEVRFLIEINGEELVHVLLERQGSSPRYASQELAALRSLEGFVESFVERHWQWRNMGASVNSAARAPLAFGVRNVIRNLKHKALTAREIDIVELTIKGHSSKSIAHELGISDGTVINHKRNIYGKLEISSQAQLFHLFLRALYGSGLSEP